MKPINTSIFDFPTLLAKGCVYVDKTAQIYELVKPSADGIYFFEFKFAQSADAALTQCRKRNYAARFVGENLPVHYVGVNYNPAADVRTIDDVKCERAA